MKLWSRNTSKVATTQAAECSPFVFDPDMRREKIIQAINSIQAYSRKGLWGMLLFLAASLAAFFFQEFGLSSCFSPETYEMLGPPPMTVMVDILLVVSTFSSVVNIAGRINEGGKPRKIWTHLGFRILFYGLYFVADALSARILTVFLTGILVLGLEQYALWLYASRTIREERQLLVVLAQ